MRNRSEMPGTVSADDQEASSVFEKFRQSKVAKGAAVTLGAAALVGGILKMDYDRHPAPKEKADQVAAIEIAKRFDCTLLSLEDTGQEPTDKLIGQGEDPSGRTTVKIRVGLNEVPEARPSMEKYADSGAVIWSPPVITGAVNLKTDELALPELSERKQPLAGTPYQETRKEGSYPDSLDVELYPKTDYPDGKQARIYVSTSVMTADSPEGDTYTRYEMNGSIDCGAMIFDGATRTWKILPHPQQSESIVKIDATVFEDKDGDNVWQPAVTE